MRKKNVSMFVSDGGDISFVWSSSLMTYRSTLEIITKNNLKKAFCVEAGIIV
jgi:hypothetical protein